MGINQLFLKALGPALTYKLEQKKDINLYGTLMQYKDKLIHEHDFTTVRTKGSNNSFMVHCTTCDADYCSICGKALHKKSRCIYHI
jgi:hypothetical protein